MRTAYFGQQFLADQGKIYGINLGYDHCAEHEWGINHLEKDFAITAAPHVFGIEKRKIHSLPKGFHFFRDKGMLGICSSTYTPKLFLDKEIASTWDSSNFCVMSKNLFMKDLHEAFQNLDIIMGIGASANPFANGGLVICIASRFPFGELLYNNDKEHYLLNKEAHESGIYDELEVAGKKFYALVPKKENNELKFWLNPQEQNKYNFGWFTLQDLRDWTKNTGKVIKNA